MQNLEKISKSIGLALLATTIVGSLIAAVILAVDYILIIFLAVLFGVFLTKVSGLIESRTPLNYGWSLGLLTLGLILSMVICLVFFGVGIEQRLQQTSAQLDRSSQKIIKWMEERPLVSSAFSKIPLVSQILTTGRDSPSGSIGGLGKELQRQIAEVEQAAGGGQGSNQDQWATNSSERPRNTNRMEAGAGVNKDAETDGETRSQADLAQAKQTGRDQQDNDTADRDEAQTGEATTRDDQVAANTSESKQSAFSSQQPTSGDAQAVQSAVGKVFSVLGEFLSTTMGAVANLLIVFFIGLFIAATPELYQCGIVRLFPIDKRDRAKEILDRVGTTMFNWLNGRFLAMFITGVGTGLALFLLGVPMAFMIGVITGLLTFIPNIGAVIALLLAMLMALSQGPATVVWVVVIYGVLQLVESNVITPLVQQHQTSIPPALLLGFQIIMGGLTGFLGVLVSTPLLAGMQVLVKEIWIKDVLGDPMHDDKTSGDNSDESNKQNESDKENRSDSDNGCQLKGTDEGESSSGPDGSTDQPASLQDQDDLASAH